MDLRRRIAASAFAATIALAGCSSTGEDAADDRVEDETGENGVAATVVGGDSDDGGSPANGTTSTAASEVTTSEPPISAPPTSAPPTSAPSTAPVIEAAASSAPQRLATAGPGVAGVLQWIETSAQVIGEAGAIDVTVSDEFAEVADAGELGLVFQRSVEEPAIWITADGSTRALIRAGDGQRLVLEGVGVDESGAVVVWYQRIDTGSLSNQQASLRSFEIETGVITEIAETGSRDERTDFSALSGGVVMGRWAGPATEGTNLVDLDRVGTAFGGGTQPECSDGQPDCAVYGAATYDEATGEAFAMRLVFNVDAARIDRGGLFRLDPATGQEEPLVAFGWDDGAWYPDDMFIAGDLVIVSLRNGAGDPLPALVYDRSTDAYWTLPDAVFVRPAFRPTLDG